MGSPAGVRKSITLEEFLQMPEIDERPYLEYLDGKIEAKVSSHKKHAMFEKRLVNHNDAHAEPRGLPGYRLPIAELFGWLKLRHRNAPASPGEST
jgi:hypothetical protein